MKRLTTPILLSFIAFVSFSLNANSQTTKTPLYEVFTSSTCGPCKPGNEHMTPIFDQYKGEIVVIKYQMSWPGTGDPYFTSEAGNRRTYYGISGIPELIRLGTEQQPTSLTTTDIDNDLLETAKMNIELRYYVDSPTVYVTARWEALEEIAGPSHRFFILITEKRTENNIKSNGETEFFNVFKKMLPDADGDILTGTIAAQQSGEYDLEYTFQGNYRLPANADDETDHSTEHSVEDFANLEVVMFAQNLLTGEVYNAALGELVPGETDLNRDWGAPLTSVKEETNTTSIRVFPNPASDRAWVESPAKNQLISLQVYDITGALVTTNFSLNANRALVDISPLPSGIYLVECATANGKRFTNRLVIK